MDLLANNLFNIQLLMESGGTVLWIILFASVLMWTLIAERYYFVYFVHPSQLETTLQKWQQRDDRQSWYAQQIRKGFIANEALSLKRYILFIKTLTVALPMLGLLGTVDGMIQTFDVLSTFGTGNARGMAGGISIALITTMAGLLTALSGIYFCTQLEQKVARSINNLTDVLQRG